MHLSLQLLARELDVSRLLDHVELRHGAHQRMHGLVDHRLALERVEQLFGDEDGGKTLGRVGDRLQDPAQEMPAPADMVLGASERGGEAREHRRMATFIGDLGEHPVRVV